MSELFRICAAPLVWLASFSMIYGLHGIGCAERWADVEVLSVSLFRVLLLAAWLGAILASTAVLMVLRSDRFGSRSAFMRSTSLATAWAGLVATLWTLHPVAVVSSCS